MPFFAWSAPLFKLADGRWSHGDFEAVADMLRPYVTRERPILDLAGGTGGLSAGVASALGVRVVIADATREMLVRLSAHRLVSVRLAAAEALPFPDGYFDALLCSDAFHHFWDQDGAAREMARVVRLGGGAVIRDIEPRGLGRVAAYVERLLHEPAAFMTATQMTAFMARHGIVGTTTRHRGSTYSFLGTVSRT